MGVTDLLPRWRPATVHRASRGWGYAAVLLATMLSQCVCQNKRPDEPLAAAGASGRPGPAPSATSALPPRLDVHALDDDERRVLAKVLADQYDPCGGSGSFADSLAAADTCELARDLGELAVDLVSKGLPRRRIVRALLEETARRAAHVTVALDGVPSEGEAATASHVVVEFTDFQCAYCRDAAASTRAAVKRHGAILYVKMYPLSEIHAHARAAALAALAAHRQGRFWQAYDALFAAQDRIRDDARAIREAVAAAGLDMDRFERDVADPAVTAALERDLAEAKRFGLEGTPTFYVDGMLVDSAGLEAALAAPAAPAAATPR